MKQVKLSEVDKNEITTKALSELKKLGGVEDIISEVSTRMYNYGETTHYNIILNGGKRIRVKAGSDNLINTMCKLADVELLRVSEKGVQEDKLLGWIIKSNN